MPNIEKISPYALTTLQRVKGILTMSDSDWDDVLSRYINSVTDFIERSCGKSGLEKYPNDGHFAQKTYTREVYSVGGYKQQQLLLKNSPVFWGIITANVTANSTSVTGIASTAGMAVGMPVLADGVVPQNTTIAAVVNSTSITLNQPASITQTGAILEVSGLISFEWRAGTPSNPSWTAFIRDQYELEQQGYTGVIRVYGAMPSIYSNMLRATYVAGYPLDWQNAGNGTSHRLPADLSECCENIVVRRFKRRELAGKSSESLQGATTAWKDRLDDSDLQTIQKYTRYTGTF
jgi:hypothetical protein